MSEMRWVRGKVEETPESCCSVRCKSTCLNPQKCRFQPKLSLCPACSSHLLQHIENQHTHKGGALLEHKGQRFTISHQVRQYLKMNQGWCWKTKYLCHFTQIFYLKDRINWVSCVRIFHEGKRATITRCGIKSVFAAQLVWFLFQSISTPLVQNCQN